MTELFLIAHVAGRWVAIAAAQVDSVVDIEAVVPVPCAAAAVRGLAALRSRVVTVVDPRVALSLPPAATPDRAVVAMIDGHHYAFLVDALEDVAGFERTAGAAGVGGGGSGGGVGEGGWSALGRDVVVRDGAPLLVLDLAALVPAAPATALAA